MGFAGSKRINHGIIPFPKRSCCSAHSSFVTRDKHVKFRSSHIIDLKLAMKQIILLFFLAPVLLVAQNKVGIGTDSPAFKLDIRSQDDSMDAPDLQLATPSANHFLRLFGGRNGDPRPFLLFSEDDVFRIATSGSDYSNFTERLTILSDGRVGIGTQTPQAKLDVVAEGDGVAILQLSSERPWVFKQRDNGPNTRLTLQSTSEGKFFDIRSHTGTNRAAEFLLHSTYSRVMLVPDGGEVGIGVNDASGKLHISHNSTINFPQLRITEEEDEFGRIKFESSVNPGAFWDIAGKADTITGNSRLNFFFKNDLNAGDRMTITGDGRVGIGTVNPTAKLDVASIGNGAGVLSLSTERPWIFKQINTGSNTQLALQPTTDLKRFKIISQNGTKTVADFFSSNSSSAVFLVPDEGRVGIGTTSFNNKVGIRGNTNSTENVLDVSTAYSGNSNISAIRTYAIPATGYGLGGDFNGGARGLKANALGSSSTNWAIAVEASAYGTAGTRIGLFGRATGGTTNWAGYFAEGNVYMTNELRIGSGAINGTGGYKLVVDGKIITEELRIQLSTAWPDYVFDDEYELINLSALEAAIKSNGHLPGIPSASKVKEQGIAVGEMQARMMEKIEELTLYIIALDKANTDLRERLTHLENK